jgi:holo-[acyl-carrier protein] synthase
MDGAGVGGGAAAAGTGGGATMAGVAGVGIDAVEVARLRRLLERLPRAYERLFSAQERAYSDDFADPYPRYAARFAAKEAVGKALGIGIIGFVWREIEVLSGGQPKIALCGHVADIAAHLGVTRIELSLSHTAGMAYAVAVAVTEGGAAGAGEGTDA